MVDQKLKGRARDNCRRALNIEFEQDWSVGLGAMLGDGEKMIKYFSSYNIFSGKADNAIFFGFECTINPHNLIKIVGTIFEKMKILNSFLV